MQPWEARRSRFGVWNPFAPNTPTSAYPWSSVKMMTKLGRAAGFFAAFEVRPQTNESVATNHHVDRRSWVWRRLGLRPTIRLMGPILACTGSRGRGGVG